MPPRRASPGDILSGRAKAFRKAGYDYFRRLLMGIVTSSRLQMAGAAEVNLPPSIKSFVDMIVEQSDTGSTFAENRPGDLKYGHAFLEDDGSISYLPPAADGDAGKMQISVHQNKWVAKHGTSQSPHPQPVGHIYTEFPDWVVTGVVEPAYIAKVFRLKTRYWIDRPDARREYASFCPDGDWTFSQIEALLPPAVQYVIPASSKSLVPFLDFDDLPDDTDSVAMIFTKLVEALSPQVKILCLTRKKGEYRYGAHFWLVNCFLPIGDIKLIAEMFPRSEESTSSSSSEPPCFAADQSVYAPGHLFRMWPYQKIGKSVYRYASASAVARTDDYEVNNHGTSPALKEEYEKIMTDCGFCHMGKVQEIGVAHGAALEDCYKCMFTRMCWIFRNTFAFQQPKKAIKTQTELFRAPVVTDYEEREDSVIPTPYGSFHQLTPKHVYSADISDSIKKLLRVFPRSYVNWESAARQIDSLLIDIRDVFGRNCVPVIASNKSMVACVTCGDNGKQITFMTVNEAIAGVYSKKTVILDLDDARAATARKRVVQFDHSLCTGVTYTSARTELTMKMNVAEMLKGFLGEGREITKIPYNPLLLRDDHGDKVEEMRHTISYIPWDETKCYDYMRYAAREIDYPRGACPHTLDEIADVMAETFTFIRKLFMDPEEKDPMELYRLWFTFLQMRMLFPIMSNELVEDKPVPQKRVPPLVWYFQGAQGAGKSIFVLDWLKALFGPQDVQLYRKVDAGFTQIDPTALFGICNEVKPTHADGSAMILIKQSTDENQTAENKGRDVVQVLANYSMILITNPMTDQQVAKLFYGIAYEDRRIIAVRGSEAMTEEEGARAAYCARADWARLWQTYLTLGFGYELREAIVSRIPWVEHTIVSLNAQAELAANRATRPVLYDKWLRMRAPTSLLKQEMLKIATRSKLRMINLFADSGVNFCAGMSMKLVGLAERLDPNMWDEKYWLRLCSFTGLMELYRAIAATCKAGGRFCEFQNSDVNVFFGPKHEKLKNMGAFDELPFEKRIDPEYSCTIGTTHIYFPARDVARENFRRKTSIVLKPKYAPEPGTPQDPSPEAIAVATSMPAYKDPYHKHIMRTAREVESLPEYMMPQFSFDAILAPIVVFNLQPERVLSSTVALEVNNYRDGMGDQQGAVDRARQVIISRSSSYISSQDSPYSKRGWDDELLNSPDLLADFPQTKRARV